MLKNTTTKMRGNENTRIFCVYVPYKKHKYEMKIVCEKEKSWFFLNFVISDDDYVFIII